MPLFRVAVREKQREEGAAGPNPAPTKAETHGPAKKYEDRSGAEQGGRSGLPAIAAGAIVGLLAVGALSFYVVRARGSSAAAPPAPQAPAEVVGAPSPTPRDPGFVDARMGPSSINPDYNLEDVVAEVGGNVISMRDLDRAVRVARVLGDLSGEPVPENGEPALKAYQIRMLKRLVDLELMAQAAQREGLQIPGGPTDDAVDGYLQQVGKTRDDLDAAMTARGVSAAELDQWFRQGRASSFYVTQSLMADHAGEDHDKVTADWLAAQWQTTPITINFYDPSEIQGATP